MRVKRLQISPEIIIGLLQENPAPEFWTRVSNNPLPKDARCIRAGMHEVTDNYLTLVIESDSYEDVIDGGTIPLCDPVALQVIRKEQNEEVNV